MAREDANAVRLTVAFNEIVKRGLDPKLPDDLQGDAIPQQVLQHEAALTGRSTATSTETGAQGQGGAVFEKTRSLLTRVRHSTLGSFPDPNDPRIDELGQLGVGENPGDDLERLANLAVTIAPHVAAGTVAVVDDLRPDALQAHADLHRSLMKDKGQATATRQTRSKTLKEERDETREMLQRVKNFVKAYKLPLTDFGFDLPVPPKRPRLARGEKDPVAES
jgi:hypothetical protein